MLRADQTIVFDTDVVLPFKIYDGDGLTDEELQALIDAGTAPEKDVTGWDLGFSVRKKPQSPDPPLIYKETGGNGVTIEGIFGGSPAQTVEVTLEDTDTYDPDSSPTVLIKEGIYAYSLKRLGPGVETVLVCGKLTIVRTTGWE